MIPEVPISVRIALFQVLVVIVGVFMTRVAFMMSGYPESNLDWNGLALLVRNYGFTLLLIPVRGRSQRPILRTTVAVGGLVVGH